ncbi:MAG TPA: RelA/SpoT domain-containing protein [Candidatus Binatia bacterium]|nr:RelA/SpoT domain-containing protein [Candidatus Binatia bacterium]
MRLDEYERASKQVYEDFAKFIGTSLREALLAHDQIRLQHVQHRSKSLKSLRQKLAKVGVTQDEAHIESKIKDLAGCRLVFYTNSDVSRFLQSGIINEVFEIDWERTKFHYPTEISSGQFRSHNFVVRLKPDQASRLEFEIFRGLLCEVQVQTALNHAWSEMEHDIYKKPTLGGFGAALMQSIEERMNKIMRDYLLPAGFEFQKVRDDFERLASGKELFDQDALRALTAATDNNQRFDLLEKFHSYVLPLYDDLAAVQADIRAAVASVVASSRSAAVRPIETTFGPISGMAADHVFGEAMEIVDAIRYAGPDAVQCTFDLICDFYVHATTDSQRNRLLQSAEHLAENELSVWGQAGPIVQHILAERILESDLAAAGPIRPVLLKILSELLKPEVRGTSSTYKTITLSTRAVDPSDALVTIRARSIDALKKLFRFAKHDDERREVMQTLWEATAIPQRGNYPDSLLHLVLRNSLELVEFYSEEAKSLSFELLQKIEHDFLWLYRWNREMPADAQRNASVREAAAQLIAAILRFRDVVNGDQSFVTYKVLVGFESVFPPAWKDEKFEYESEQAYRTGEIERLVDQVENRSADDWLQIIKRCSSTKSNDLATFPSFSEFLELLGKRKPAIALRYLDNMEGDLEPCIPATLKGIEGSTMAEKAAEKIGDWVSRRMHLGRILWYYRFSLRLELAAVERAATAALEAKDQLGIANSVEVVAARYEDLGAKAIDAILLPAIDHLESNGSRHWTGGVWIHGNKSPFQNLTDQQATRVLAHLVSRSTIDMQLDQLLLAIGKAHPEKLIDFFGARVRRERELKTDPEAAKYDAIPFRLHAAERVLKILPDYLLSSMRTWYREDDELFSLRAGRFARSIYPKITAELAASFMRVVEVDGSEDLAFVLETLERFDGAEETRPIYKAIIQRLPIGDPLLRDVSIGLNATGVVSGEFGFVEAYKAKRAIIASWLEDRDEKVRQFATHQVAQLDRMIASEQRQAEESLELRKRTYGTGPADEGKSM